ncbi:hypothetical protein H920_14809 [Fukomys damarensis]|uniref:Uncharacterized protein n=1 Tax=Fukomys damarensis TaxID=885580 RepID=A0A091D0C7_FUKDA|nr:hypothetical protein H920_14809 [Fukomys damarensis]
MPVVTSSTGASGLIICVTVKVPPGSRPEEADKKGSSGPGSLQTALGLPRLRVLPCARLPPSLVKVATKRKRFEAIWDTEGSRSVQLETLAKEDSRSASEGGGQDGEIDVTGAFFCTTTATTHVKWDLDPQVDVQLHRKSERRASALVNIAGVRRTPGDRAASLRPQVVTPASVCRPTAQLPLTLLGIKMHIRSRYVYSSEETECKATAATLSGRDSTTAQEWRWVEEAITLVTGCHKHRVPQSK